MAKVGIRETLLRALSQYRGDDLERAQRAFGTTNLDEQYGQSGRTRRQILAEYQEHADECARARKWVEDNT